MHFLRVVSLFSIRALTIVWCKGSKEAAVQMGIFLDCMD